MTNYIATAAALTAFVAAISAPISENHEENEPQSRTLMSAWNALAVVNMACAEALNDEVDAWINAHFYF